MSVEVRWRTCRLDRVTGVWGRSEVDSGGKCLYVAEDPIRSELPNFARSATNKSHRAFFPPTFIICFSHSPINCRRYSKCWRLLKF